MNILLVYYHPVVFDLIQSFRLLGHSVSLAVNTKIKDNYGTGQDIVKNNKDRWNDVDVISLPLAVANIKKKKYDLIGCDGVFDGDKLVMDTAESVGVPHFCIQGYPNKYDEPSDNILSLGWALPLVQYNQAFPAEGYKKEVDWADLAKNGRSTHMKNICVFYPCFHEYKEKIASTPDNFPLKLRSGFLSLVQGYERWNKFSCDVFKQISEKVPEIQNLEGQSSEDVFNAINKTKGLLHLKWADQPGIAIFEAMLFGRPVITMRSFVLASFNQEVLIHRYNSVIADDVDELIEYLNYPDSYFFDLGDKAQKHASILTDFNRQKSKLTKFIERCTKRNS